MKIKVDKQVKQALKNKLVNDLSGTYSLGERDYKFYYGNSDIAMQAMFSDQIVYLLVENKIEDRTADFDTKSKFLQVDNVIMIVDNSKKVLHVYHIDQEFIDRYEKFLEKLEIRIKFKTFGFIFG